MSRAKAKRTRSGKDVGPGVSRRILSSMKNPSVQYDDSAGYTLNRKTVKGLPRLQQFQLWLF
jgi:hypothetical protein